MPFLTARALVIYSSIHRESDRILHLLTKEHGVIRCTASGAAKSGSQFSFAAQPGILLDVTLNQSRNYWYVKELEVVEAFRNIHEDIMYLTAAAHLLEIGRDVCVDIDTCKDVFSLLLHAFHAMNHHKKEYRLVVMAVEWKMAEVLGFPVALDKEWMENAEYAFFSFSDCRFYVKGKGNIKNKEDYQTLSKSSLQALCHMQTVPLEKLFSFSLSDSVLEELCYLSHRYLCERLEKNYSKLELLTNQWNLHDS